MAAAEALPFSGDVFDAALSLLVLQDFAEPKRAVAEMARVTRFGGTVAACQWDFRDGLPMLSLFWKTAEAVAPAAVAHYRAPNSQWLKRDASLDDMADIWVGAGLSEVRTAILQLSMKFSSFDDFWLPFLGDATPTSAFAAAINRETGGILAKAAARGREKSGGSGFHRHSISI